MAGRQVITTFSEISKASESIEAAVDDLQAEDDSGMSDLEKAALLAGINNALPLLAQCEKEAGILSSPPDRIASLLQTAFARWAAENERFEELPVGNALEAKFDSHDWRWVRTLWWMIKGAEKFAFWTPPKTPERPKQFASQCRMALFADWGTGLYGAPEIARSIRNEKHPFDIILHLGDVYYSGEVEEMKSRFTDAWPDVPGALHRALPGNHEMYCGGGPYFSLIQREPFNQRQSCFAYANDKWLLLGLDTSYDDHDINAPQLDWLKEVVAASDAEEPNRKIVLFSHHQPFSRLSGQGPHLQQKLEWLLDRKRVFAWYWGHEHFCVLYEKHPRWNLWGRCVGHGGMPEFRHGSLGKCPPTLGFRDLIATDFSPASEVLDGPNTYLGKHAKKYAPNGYLVLRFDGDKLFEEIREASGHPLRERQLG